MDILTRSPAATQPRDLSAADAACDGKTSPPSRGSSVSCGMQTQEPRPPFIGLWTRLTGVRLGRICCRHCTEHEIVRGTLMRGTLHVMSAADYAAYRLTLQPVLTRAMSVLGERSEGLDPEQGAAGGAATAPGASHAPSANCGRSWRAEFPEVNERALGFCVRMLLPLVMAPTQAAWGFPANAEFALAETWVQQPLAPGDETARRSLVLRYLAAFGPATVADVQTWSGLQSLKPVVDALRPQLRVFRDERRKELFDLPDAPRPAEDTPAPPRFLPEFDNLLLSHADRYTGAGGRAPQPGQGAGESARARHLSHRWLRQRHVADRAQAARRRCPSRRSCRCPGPMPRH